jgi:hypothetical protein
MQFILPTNKVPLTIVIGVQTQREQEMKIEAHDGGKPNTFYVNRKGLVNGYREFELKFPQSPINTVINIYNKRNGNFMKDEDKSFILTKFDVKALKTEPIWLSDDDRSFIKLAQEFSKDAGFLSAGGVDKYSGKLIPHRYGSDDNKFTIDYFDYIRDRRTGDYISTPARIGHDSGIIETSAYSFRPYTIPMRMVILLHEYSHKFKNPEINRPIGYETGADINALTMYLSLGYSEIEALQAFLYVFRGADNEGNHHRYKIIQDFVRKWKNGEIEKNYRVLGKAA